MDYPDGIYLIKGADMHFIFLCVFHDGHRSEGRTIRRPLEEIFTTNWPYMSFHETKEDFHITYVGTEDFIRGMAVISPNMTGKELLEQLGIDYTIGR